MLVKDANATMVSTSVLTIKYALVDQQAVHVLQSALLMKRHKPVQLVMLHVVIV
jgi:hypothetical protein